MQAPEFDRSRVQKVDRRNVLSFFLASILLGNTLQSEASFWEAENLGALFESATVKQPQFDPNAREDISDWLEGTWICKSEMIAFTAPLGNRFLGIFHTLFAFSWL